MWRLGPGIIKDDSGGIGGDRCVNQIVLPVRIVIMRINAYAVTKTTGTFSGGISLGLEEGVVL